MQKTKHTWRRYKNDIFFVSSTERTKWIFLCHSYRHFRSISSLFIMENTVNMWDYGKIIDRKWWNFWENNLLFRRFCLKASDVKNKNERSQFLKQILLEYADWEIRTHRNFNQSNSFKYSMNSEILYDKKAKIFSTSIKSLK